MSQGAWDIRAGQWFFRHRNALFPVIFVLVVPFCRPAVILGPAWDRALGLAGVVVALAGELVRLATIGFQYIERGGRNKQIYASFLAQRGMYGLSRNPMYVGNILIAIGLVMVAGSPSVYLLLLPFFLFVYWAIIRAEETYLLGRFGDDYARYCAQVNRWLPTWRNVERAFANMRYDWRPAVRKELSTITGLLTALILLPVWRVWFLHGVEAAKARVLRACLAEGVLLLVFWGLVQLKRARLVFYPSAEC